MAGDYWDIVVVVLGSPLLFSMMPYFSVTSIRFASVTFMSEKDR